MATLAPSAIQDSELSLHAARVAELFKAARAAYLVTPANVGILMVLLWGPVTAHVLLVWFGVVVAVTLARIGLHWRYLLARPARDAAALVWERRFALGVLATGALWTFPAAVLFQAQVPLAQMAVLFVVGGTIIGGVGVYAASRLSFYSFVTLPFLAALAQLLLQPEGIYKLLALALVFFGAAMLKVHSDLHRTLIDTLQTRRSLRDLLGELSASDARFRDAIEHFPGGFALWDERGRLSLCNETFAGVYGGGGSAEAMKGLTALEVAENAWQALRSDDAEREAWIAETIERVRSPDGRLRQLHLRDGRWMQSRWARTRRGAVVGMIDDISELKRARDSYQDLIAEEDLILDTLPVGVAFLEAGTIARCNKHLEAMLGYPAGELNGKSARILFRSDAAWNAVRRDALKRLALGPIIEADVELARKDGSATWCRAHCRGIAANDHLSGIFTFADSQERRAAEQALRTSELMFRNLVETSNDLVWTIGADQRWNYLNAAAVRRMYGYEAAEMIGRSVTEFAAQSVRERDRAVLDRVLAGESVFEYETRHRTRDGSALELSLNAVPLRGAQGQISGATGTARDVREQKRSAAALYENVEKLRLAVDAAGLRYWEWDRAGTHSPVGHASGLVPWFDSSAELRWSIHPEDSTRAAAARGATLERAEPYALDYRIVSPEGETRWIASRGKPLVDASGQVHRIIGVAQDVSERKQQEEEARFLAYHDMLTGLPNRRLLDDRLQHAVLQAKRSEGLIGVMVVDLDDFKRVNHTLGHRAGDAVLREAAKRFTDAVRRSDTLARQGGDEFVVLAPGLKTASDAELIAQKLLRSLQPGFRVDGRHFEIGASIGISLFPADAQDGDALMRNADVAMYRAKELGKNNFRFFHP